MEKKNVNSRTYVSRRKEKKGVFTDWDKQSTGDTPGNEETPGNDPPNPIGSKFHKIQPRVPTIGRGLFYNNKWNSPTFGRGRYQNQIGRGTFRNRNNQNPRYMNNNNNKNFFDNNNPRYMDNNNNKNFNDNNNPRYMDNNNPRYMNNNNYPRYMDNNNNNKSNNNPRYIPFEERISLSLNEDNTINNQSKKTFIGLYEESGIAHIARNEQDKRVEKSNAENQYYSNYSWPISDEIFNHQWVGSQQRGTMISVIKPNYQNWSLHYPINAVPFKYYLLNNIDILKYNGLGGMFIGDFGRKYLTGDDPWDGDSIFDDLFHNITLGMNHNIKTNLKKISKDWIETIWEKGNKKKNNVYYYYNIMGFLLFVFKHNKDKNLWTNGVIRTCVVNHLLTLINEQNWDTKPYTGLRDKTVKIIDNNCGVNCWGRPSLQIIWKIAVCTCILYTYYY